MSASLVGSEMCIRDSLPEPWSDLGRLARAVAAREFQTPARASASGGRSRQRRPRGSHAGVHASPR
eukprot:12696069-Alexandrium_andersonii.AAC.1